MLPTVSVCIVTFQHARFIAQAIDGALRQKTSFPVEILIGEDESTDGTRDICLDYAKRHPDRVRVSLRHRRDVVLIDGRPRGGFNFRMTLREARGEFIALCEGDDFWTDPEKLQRQVDYLRANPDCVGCIHDTKLVDAEGQTLLESYFQSDQDKFTQRDVLETLLSREPTCSLVFRKAAFAEPLPEWFLRRHSDLYIDILLTNHGPLGFVRHNMGAYRKHTGGIWSGQREANQIIELIIRYKLLLAEPSFEKYRDLLLRKIDEFQASLFTRKDGAGEIQRLEEVVQEQTKTVKTMHNECDRLTAEAKAAQAEANGAAKDGQKHIDALRTQLDQLAATSLQQSSYIAILEKERERLAVLSETLDRNSANYVKVISEQGSYIKLLEAQRTSAQP
jgi:glycosyltransferase involved in cell wall biosynthesis